MRSTEIVVVSTILLKNVGFDAVFQFRVMLLWVKLYVDGLLRGILIPRYVLQTTD